MRLEPGQFEWYYKAKVLDVYDADTITVEIDLGFGIKRTDKIRLYGINAPELRGAERPEGIRSRNVLREWVLGKSIILETIKDKSGKYGRILGKVWFEQEHPNHEDKKYLMLANDMLVASGLARRQEY